MQKEYTSNGIMFTWSLAGSRGASFTLFPSKVNTTEEIRAAKAEIRRERDAVAVYLATDDDRDDMFKAEYFCDPRTEKLRWWEIEQDAELIRRERRRGTTPEQFVTDFVLPAVERLRNEARKKYGRRVDERGFDPLYVKKTIL